MKTFSFRFDIDTPTCLVEGAPRLMNLAERLGVKFTFFLSVGKSISRRDFILRKLRGGGVEEECAAALSARAKLGNRRYAQLALLNPTIGARHPGLVRDLAQSQELGLHGGRNHDTWHRSAGGWSKERVCAELDWALSRLAEVPVQVHGFSCPGWTSAPGLAEALAERGFKYRADRHGLNEKGVVREAGGSLANLATNLVGEPGGVAFLEHMRALGRSDQEIREYFAKRLNEIGNTVVAYDHPYFAGVHELELVETCVKQAQDAGYTIVPMRDLVAAG